VDEQQRLYDDAKSDCGQLVEFLLGFAEGQVRKNGAFLPFGALLNEAGEVVPHAAMTGTDSSTSEEVLPLLHQGLRQARSPGTRAVAVCEWVTITPEDGRRTDAAKVLVEHANGLTVAFYLPMRKKFLGGWAAGEMLVLPAKPEIGA
jgi:hypothetical protein